MKFVMTGHKGLIGSFLLKKLIERGDEPALLIDAREGMNILDLDKYELKERPDVLIHLASFCKINKIIENPDFTFENNSRGIEKIMEFCKRNKIPKIIFTSSSRILSKEKNPYTASKIYGEELVKGYSQCYGMDYVIIRPSTVYGPFNDKTKRLIDIWILNALRDEELKIYGDENKTLDFTYIDDFIDGFLIAMKEKNKSFDISSGTGTKLVYVADLIIQLAGRGKRNFYEPEIAQPQEVELDISAMVKLGFNPRNSIEDGVKKTFKWYKENFEEIQQSR
ncbi:MAG: NAD-dependent epimerase/dehydratase family protein [Candidatus Nanoarchaeia archaeon]|nr:NAD-dependent epimerase/dehydratase family protein [Candidatus Nanoarchaeia archaeon]